MATCGYVWLRGRVRLSRGRCRIRSRLNPPNPQVLTIPLTNEGARDRRIRQPSQPLPRPARVRVPIVGIIRCVGKNTSFSLDEHYSAFIDEEVASGRYRSASDVVRSALRLLEDRETRLRALRQALDAGERSGEPTPFDFDEFVAHKRAEQPRRR